MRVLVNLILVFLLEVPALWSQFGSQRIMTAGENRRFSYEIISLPSASDKSRIIINTSVPLDFITLTKNPSENTGSFFGAIDLSLEIFDKEKNSVGRDIYQKELRQNEEEKKDKIKGVIDASFEFFLSPGKYDINIELNDRGSQRVIKREINDFVVKDFSKRLLSSLAFIQNRKNDQNNIKFINESGNIPFGENVSLFFVTRKGNGPDSIIMEIFKSKEDKFIDYYKKIYGKEYFLHGKNIKQSDKNSIDYEIVDDENTDLLILPIKSDSFNIQKYRGQATLLSKGISDTTSRIFDSQWQNMPVSLMDFRIAQSKLSLITSESEYSEITSGSLEIQREKFLEFWKKSDPTPTTAYNELMEEFYRRVDYAISNYTTLKEPDGSKSDMGKIYILNGKPDDIKRLLLPKGPSQEIWIYNKLGKKYYFVDEAKQGIFTLQKIEKL